MNIDTTKRLSDHLVNRREFVKLGGGAAALLANGALIESTFAGRRGPKPKPGNILLIYTDQQHIDTIFAGGCPHVRTPALDRIKRSGISFTQSYTANPVCSPARAAVFTGRTSCETSVYKNGIPIRSDIPNLGLWFSEHTD
ncbi:MAG: sulfatase-like hydrolase/transferase, partial [Planctomycetota bacterium]